jgi:heat shock protein HslJ
VNTLWRIMFLPAAMVCLHPQASYAQDLRGRWQVRSFATTMMSLDGKQKIKGPFTFRPRAMVIQVEEKRLIEEAEGKKTEYTLKKEGKDYILTRSAQNGIVTSRLSEIQKSATGITFTTTRLNNARKEHTVVQWACTPMKPQKTAPIVPTATVPNPASLSGTRWELVEIAYNNDKILRPMRGEKATLTFLFDTQVTGSAGINRFNGIFKSTADRALAFGGLASTRAANPPGFIADQYLKDLESANRYRFDKGMLILQLPVDTGVMKFRRITN